MSLFLGKKLITPILFEGTPKPVESDTILYLRNGIFEDISPKKTFCSSSNVNIASGGKYNDNCFYFNGNDSRIFATNLISGNMPFTIEMWCKPISIRNNTIYSHGGTNVYNGTGGGFELFNDRTVIYYNDGFRIIGGQWEVNEWQHVAIVGNATYIAIYLNGKKIGQYDNLYNFGTYIEDIGTNASAYTLETFNGYIDEIRFSKVARYTSDFTPPTGHYEE